MMCVPAKQYHGNHTNVIYFVFFILDPVMEMKGNGERVTEREMHVISVIKAFSAGAMCVCVCCFAATAGAEAD